MVRKSILSIALVFIPAVLVFKNFFLPGPLAWGDAPHFYPEMFKMLVGEPFAWTERGFSFGGVNMTLWLSPLIFLYGIFAKVVGNDLSIRILFYFPSLLLSIISPILLTRYLKLSKTTWFFSSLIYTLNTYYLLLVDGGQVGVALAYGLFPLALLYLKKLLDLPSLKTFYLSIISLSLLTVSDPRVTIISLLTITLWQILEFKFKSIVYLISLIFSWIGINMFWIFPLIKNNISIFSTVLATTPIRWYNTLLLFSPHWPANLFGKVERPPIYFAGIPVLIFLGVFLRKKFTNHNLKFTFLYLIFAFFSLGIIPFDKLPFGFAFRDSTKFFMPLILFAGILIGKTAKVINKKIFSIVLYLYILFLIWPAILGKMNFVLSSRPYSNDFQKIYEYLKKDNNLYRTIWFPEKHPLTYETLSNPAIDAKTLASFWPFASINTGEDVFNFLNDKNFPDIFRSLGIKYLILSGNPREISKTPQNQKDWQTISGLIDSNPKLEKVNWRTNIPVYKLKDNVYPRFYSVDKIILNVGPEISNFELRTSNFFLYPEDGKWDPSFLQGKNPNSVKILFNGGKDKSDLTMSFLQKYFLPVSQAKKNEWAYYSSKDYLKYKYELLIRGHAFSDFDYGQGIAFSTKVGEKIEFEAKKDLNYLYFVRKANKGGDLHWEQVDSNLTVENKTGLEILNVFVAVSKDEYQKARKLADIYVEHFGEIKESQLRDEKITEIPIEKFGTLKYKFSAPDNNYWLIFTDNYHPLWQLRRGIEYFHSVPIFSMVNGFYFEPKWGDLGIEFRGQENFRWGAYYSTISILVLLIIYLWKRSSQP